MCVSVVCFNYAKATSPSIVFYNIQICVIDRIYFCILQVMIAVHLGLWLGANVYTLRLLRVEPKDNFNLGAYHAACMVPPPDPRQYPNNQSERTEPGQGEGQARNGRDASHHAIN